MKNIRNTHTYKVLWAMFLGALVVTTGVISVLTYLGVSPSEAVTQVTVIAHNVNQISNAISIANEINIEGLEDLAEIGRELKERDIVGKLDNYLTP